MAPPLRMDLALLIAVEELVVLPVLVTVRMVVEGRLQACRRRPSRRRHQRVVRLVQARPHESQSLQGGRVQVSGDNALAPNRAAFTLALAFAYHVSLRVGVVYVKLFLDLTRGIDVPRLWLACMSRHCCPSSTETAAFESVGLGLQVWTASHWKIG